MSKGVLPELLFVAPIGTKHKIRHRHVVFTIDEVDDAGVPSKLTLVGMDEKIDVTEHPYGFMTAYIQEQMLEPDEERKKGLSGKPIQ